MRQFFHPKKWASAAGPWLELLQAVLFLAFALVIFNILADIIQRLLQTRKGGAA